MIQEPLGQNISLTSSISLFQIDEGDIVMTSIQDIYIGFMTVYNRQSLMMIDSTILYQSNLQHDGHLFSKDMYNAIVEHCFMQIFLAWETFLEKSFISYLQNATDLQGTSYNRYGAPQDDIHAYNMIKGTKNYPDWTNISDVICLSNIYFDSAGAYAVLSSFSPEIEAIKTIRNRISHVSEKSVRQFNNLLARNIAQTDLNVGDYLMLLKDGRQTYFTYYIELLKDYVEAICNK